MLPLTLPELLAAAKPLVALEACPVCSGIPRSCSRVTRHGETSDGLAPGVQQLLPFIDAIVGYKPSIERCPTCHRLYECESGYEYLVDGSEDYTTYARVDDVEALFHSDWFTRVRVDDRELVGDALLGTAPRTRRSVEKIAPRTFFRRHAVVQVALDYGRKRVWLALPDDHRQVEFLTGNLDGLALVAARDPASELAARVMEYASFVDEVTSEHDFRTLTLPEAPRVDTADDGLVVTRWGISQRRLIRRTLSIAPNGAARRVDVVER